MDRNRGGLSFSDRDFHERTFLVDQKLLCARGSSDGQPFCDDSLRSSEIVAVAWSKSNCGEQFWMAIFIDAINRNDGLVADRIKLNDACRRLAAGEIDAAVGGGPTNVVRATGRHEAYESECENA